jgi:hypothetical protein
VENPLVVRDLLDLIREDAAELGCTDEPQLPVGTVTFRGTIGAIGRAALLSAAVTSGAAAAEKSFALAITGAEGASYNGQCTLTTAAGKETVEISGVVPRHQEFTAEAIACRIESAGSIALEIAHDGSLSRSRISGGTAHLAAR